jgi:hypothetical protein
MRKTICIAIAALAACGAANAAEPAVARLVQVSGNVLVSNEMNIASAHEALRLAPGMRVLVTLNSAAVVEYANGCRVRLAAGERLEIRAGERCEQRTAAKPAVTTLASMRP